MIEHLVCVLRNRQLLAPSLQLWASSATNGSQGDSVRRELKVTIKVDTRAYINAHGEKPSGTCLWAFDLKARTKEPLWQTTYVCSGTYDRAAARAKRLVQRDFRTTDGTLVLLP